MRGRGPKVRVRVPGGGGGGGGGGSALGGSRGPLGVMVARRRVWMVSCPRPLPVLTPFPHADSLQTTGLGAGGARRHGTGTWGGARLGLASASGDEGGGARKTGYGCPGRRRRRAVAVEDPTGVMVARYRVWMVSQFPTLNSAAAWFRHRSFTQRGC